MFSLFLRSSLRFVNTYLNNQLITAHLLGKHDEIFPSCSNTHELVTCTQSQRVCLVHSGEEAFSDAVLQVFLFLLLLLSIRALQRRSYQSADAPPTTGDPLITSHTTWTGLLHNSTHTHTVPHKLISSQNKPLFTKPMSLIASKD